MKLLEREQTENNERLIKVLEYLECPQYLRKTLFPPHKYLEHVGLLNPIESTHHLKRYDNWIYREGVVVDNLPMKKDASGSWVDVGLVNVNSALFQVKIEQLVIILFEASTSRPYDSAWSKSYCKESRRQWKET